MMMWKDEIEMLDILIKVIGKTAWLKPEEQNEMIRWVERQKKARKAVA